MRWAPALTHRRLVLAGAILLALAATVAIGRREAPPPSHASPSMGTVDGRFAVLSRATSNQCSLDPEGLMRTAPGMRVQGSCCRPMDRRRYVEQVRELRRFSGVSAIPPDPYDVSVRLAQTLVRYDRDIVLSPQGQREYDEAMRLSHEHGPCCCHCWRWTAFEGQAKFLLTRLDYSPQLVAQVWGLEDGCGGAE